jgi:hypothetical protein
MRKSIRFMISLMILGLVATQFLNCSEYSNSSSLYGTDCASTGTCNKALSVTENTGYLSPRSTQPVLECTHDHIQVGGACEAGNSSDSYIEYYLTDSNNNRVTWDGGINLLREARCENGRFFMLVPRPPNTIVATDPANPKGVCSTGECTVEYRLNSRLFSLRKNTSQFEVVAVAPVLPLKFQLVLSYNGGSFCP